MSNSVQTHTTLEELTLPVFLTRENKYFYGALMFAVSALIYLGTNHYHLYPPRTLPMTLADRLAPFLPNSVWVYTSEYVFFALIYIYARDMVNANKYFYSFLALQIASAFIFMVWPTTYPRESFPLPEDLNAVTYYLFSWLRQTDTPANCCPSLHVSSVYLSAFIYLDDQRGKFPFFFLWATAIAVSTLTTKQHYLIDVGTGFLMAVIFYWIFHRLVNYRPAQAKR